ncbi:MAG: tetratricopeptide repeat protein [Bryobacteraceae bacterium]
MISCFSTRALVVTVALTISAGAGFSQQLQQGDKLRASTASLPSPVAPQLQTPGTGTHIALTPEMRGDIYMARKMYREAIDKYRECTPSAQIENKIGIAFHQLLEFQLAKQNYERAIKMDPKYAQAINNLGTIYYSQRSYNKALKDYRKALKLDPNSASIWVNLGSDYFAKHDMKRAAQAYDKALQLDPEVFERRSQYGTLLQERTVEDRARFHLYLAKAYAQRGDKERALLYLRKALEEGVKERKKIPDMPEFASIRTDQAFKDLLLQNPKPL